MSNEMKNEGKQEAGTETQPIKGLLGSDGTSPTGMNPTEQNEEDRDSSAKERSSSESERSSSGDGETVDKYIPVNMKDLKVPEGMNWDDEAWKEFLPIAEEAQLSKEQVQRIVDLYSSKLGKAESSFKESEAANSFAQSSEWEKASKADKRFGGAKLNESLALANKTIQAFGSPELMSFLNTSAVGNHPEVINFFVSVGKALSEDSYVGGKAKSEVQLKDIMYKD